MKKFIKRTAALFLCIVMVLPMCLTFASAGYGDKAGQLYQYNTLDEIPEDLDIFKPICTGDITKIEINGDFYFEFRLSGYPIVRIKASAFTNKPTNGYLDADNKALSENCKNPPPEGEYVGGASRVCYYKTMTEGTLPSSSVRVYTFSMYRLKLSANAENCMNVYVDAKLTNAVTFRYYDTWEVLVRCPTIAIRPSVSVALTDSPANTRFTSCKVLEGFGDYSPELSASESINVGANAIFCVGSVAALIEAPNKATITAAVTECTPLVISAIDYNEKKGHYSVDAGNNNPTKYPYQDILSSPVKLRSYNDYVSLQYVLNSCPALDSVNYLVSFSFT